MRTHLFILLLIVAGALTAQDLHFSQFNEQPALVNPALTGATAPSRASVVYRNQWRSISAPYVTSGASFESRFNSTNWQQVDKFRSMTFKERSTGRMAAGLSVYKDNAGDGNMGSTQVNLSIASFVPTSRESYIALGLQAGWVQWQIDNSRLVFPNQYNGSGYDNSLNSNESFQSLNYSYADFAGGILWNYGRHDKGMLGKKQLKGNIGISVYHLNKPRQHFLTGGGPDAYSLKFVLHGDLLASLRDPDYAIAPSYLLQFRGTSSEVLAGLLLRRYINMDSKYTGIVKRSFIGFGAYYRNRDAAILMVALELKEQFAIGVSYDLNVSRLVAGTNARGGLEITLRYTPPNAFLYQKKEKNTDPKAQ